MESLPRKARWFFAAVPFESSEKTRRARRVAIGDAWLGILSIFMILKRGSVVQWHPFSPLFLVAAPLKVVFPKGSLFFQGH